MTRVSVIIPTYNRGNVLDRAINSAIQQTCSDLEILVVDDASTDNTEKLVKNFDDMRIRYIRHEKNRGGGAARNTGIKSAIGEYIAFLDSDDEWVSTKLESQLSELESRSNQWIANYCDYSRAHLDTISQVRRKWSELIFPDNFNSYNQEGGDDLIPDILSMEIGLGGSSTLIAKREHVEKIGGFDERFQRHQDWEFLIRLLSEGKLSYTDEELVIKHEGGSPSAQVEESAKKLFLSKFKDDVRRAEQDGYSVVDVHMRYLMRAYWKEGKFWEGYRYFQKSDGLLSSENGIDKHEVVTILWCLAAGTTKRVQSIRE